MIIPVAPFLANALGVRAALPTLWMSPATISPPLSEHCGADSRHQLHSDALRGVFSQTSPLSVRFRAAFHSLLVDPAQCQNKRARSGGTAGIFQRNSGGVPAIYRRRSGAKWLISRRFRL